MLDFVRGALQFENTTFKDCQKHFKDLVHGQKPNALFITCSDSRLDPNLITQSKPGELFICRNVGNIVPPHSHQTGAMTVCIEYSLGILNVPHIVVCGHYGCGAIQAAMQPESVCKMPHTSTWLSYVEAATLVVQDRYAELDDAGKLDHLVEENIRLRTSHLRTHPYVVRALAQKRLQIHGWVFDLRKGKIKVFREEQNEFVSLREKYN